MQEITHEFSPGAVKMDENRREQVNRLMLQYEKDMLKLCYIYLRDYDLAQEALQDTGADVIGVATILDYEFHERTDAFRTTDLEWHALTSYTSVIEKACEMGRINAAEAEIIRTWHLKPGNWMPQNKTVRNKKK